jgi:Tfp pilus assembly protein FimT
MHADTRAQGGGTNLVGLIIGIVIAAIVGVAVGIPVINDAINSTNLSGTTALIVGFIPVMIGLMIFVATASPIMRRM